MSNAPITTPVVEHAVQLIRLVVKSFLADGNHELARELIEQMRIACDEMTADVNARGTCRARG